MENNHAVFKIFGMKELSAVTFIRDYVQLQFDGPYINAYVWPRVSVQTGVFDLGTSGYRDVLCAQINKVIEKIVEESDVRLLLFFTDRSQIEISLREVDRRTPDAVMLQDGTGQHWTAL